MSTLVSEIDSSRAGEADGEDMQPRGKTVLEQMEDMQDELSRLEVGLVWVHVVEQVLLLRYVPRCCFRNVLRTARKF